MLTALIRAAKMDRDILARFIHGFLCTSTCVVGLSVPASMSGMVRAAAGPVFGDLLILASGVVGALIIVDTYINDVRPPDEQLAWTSRHRHWLHVLGSLGNFVALYTVAVSHVSTPVLVGTGYFYLGTAAFGVVIAWRDVQRRPGHALCGT